MNTTKQQLNAIADLISESQQLRKTAYDLIKELPQDYKIPATRPDYPFSIYQQKLADSKPSPVHWLWQNRIPLYGITLLDGDHGCGKSLLTLQIAASVSSGKPMPDGTPTIRGGVVIVTPNTDANTTQLQLLTALGADLSRIEILSYIQDQDEDQDEDKDEPSPSSHTSTSHQFSLPEDIVPLLQAMDRVDARLVIFDPFINLLSRNTRYTDQKLYHLLADLNQGFTNRYVACLITRNCHARGGNARPTVLERSDHFSTIAVSRLLLAPDPMQPDYLLLSHALNRHAALTPTLIIQIRPTPEKPNLPYITIRGTHSLRAKELIESRPDTLHRQLLSEHLLRVIAASSDPIHVSNLYYRSPQSSPFQIQRSLADLLNMGQIERPARGFYTHIPTPPIFSPNQPAPTTPIPEPTTNLNQTAATTSTPEPATNLNQPAPTPSIPEPTTNLNQPATTTPIPEPTTNLNQTAATTPIPEPATNLNQPATTTSTPEPITNLNQPATTTPIPEPVNNLNQTAATTNQSTSITTQSLGWVTS